MPIDSNNPREIYVRNLIYTLKNTKLSHENILNITLSAHDIILENLPFIYWFYLVVNYF
jgi:hypothetical protein